MYFSIFNSYKIYDLEPERHVQAWFLVLFSSYSALMMALNGIDLLTKALMEIMLWLSDATASLPEIKLDFILYLIAYPLVLFLADILSLTYAVTLITNKINKENRSSLPAVLRRILPLTIFSLISGGVHVLSMFLLEIPYFIFLAMFYYVPIEIVANKKSISRAMEDSWHLTKGKRLFILSSVIAITFFIRFAAQFFASLLASTAWAASLIMGFAFAFRILSAGRLNGLLYLLHNNIIEPKKIDGL